jgi:hypothetical protein
MALPLVCRECNVPCINEECEELDPPYSKPFCQSWCLDFRSFDCRDCILNPEIPESLIPALEMSLKQRGIL